MSRFYRLIELTNVLGPVRRAGNMRVATYPDDSFTEDHTKAQFAHWICGCTASARIGPDPRWKVRSCATHGAI